MGGGGFGAPMGGGGSFFPMGGLAGFGFLPFFGLRQRHPAATPDDGSTPVDSDALVDQNNPGHREAIQTISHVDDEKHENILQWIKDELHKLEA